MGKAGRVKRGDVREALTPLLPPEMLEAATDAVMNVARREVLGSLFDAQPGDLVWVRYYNKREAGVFLDRTASKFRAVVCPETWLSPDYTGRLGASSYLGARTEVARVDELFPECRVAQFSLLQGIDVAHQANLKKLQEAP